MGGKRHGGQKTGGQKAGGQKAWGAKGRGAKDRGAKDRGAKDRGAKDRGAKVLEPSVLSYPSPGGLNGPGPAQSPPGGLYPPRAGISLLWRPAPLQGLAQVLTHLVISI